MAPDPCGNHCRHSFDLRSANDGRDGHYDADDRADDDGQRDPANARARATFGDYATSKHDAAGDR